ncbi:MAG: cysteine desulfurase NifS [candidate division NC10 bacterium RIFCSPLOWO2_02_FULL_66_22]|nr:MAG: cysteine desulfurase NifS [candidate division NC10 bacterium RIFCSPLOWO2_02_FULL_66_22]
MRVYLDHNATTPLHPEVLAAMLPFLTERFGNPSSLHAWGQEARQALEQARTTVARALGSGDKDSVVFTAGGTEADNLALLGAAAAQETRGRHVIVSAVEHHAVLHAAAHLQRHGFAVTRLPVDGQGLLDPDEVRRAIRPDTILVSLLHGNNETGVLFPIDRVGRICRERGVTFHTDAVQSFGKLPLDVGALQVDLLSLSGHKIHGPKGVGALCIRRGTQMQALIHGGTQERSRRAGTENVAAAVGLARATELALLDQEAAAKRLADLRDRLEHGLMSALRGVLRNGHAIERLPHTTNLAFAGAEAESLILALDLSGVGISSGAACSSGSLEPSHVLAAMGLPRERAESSVRFSLGRGTTPEEIARVLEILPPIVERMRRVNAGRAPAEART